jgi:hypothetical protein
MVGSSVVEIRKIEDPVTFNFLYKTNRASTETLFSAEIQKYGNSRLVGLHSHLS